MKEILKRSMLILAMLTVNVLNSQTVSTASELQIAISNATAGSEIILTKECNLPVRLF